MRHCTRSGTARVVIPVLLLGLLFWSTACGSQVTPVTTPAAAVTLTLWQPGLGWEDRQSVADALAPFAAQHPGVHATVISPSWSEAYQTLRQGRVPAADLLYLPDRWLPLLPDQALLPVANSPGIPVVAAPLRRALTISGTWLAVPVNYRVDALIYRTWNLSEEPVSWDRLIQRAARVPLIRPGTLGLGFTLERNLAGMQTFLDIAAGLAPAPDRRVPASEWVQGAGAMKALSWLKQIFEDERGMVNPTVAGPAQLVHLFNSNRLGMLIGDASLLPQLQGSYRVAPLPGRTVAVDGLAVVRDSAHRSLAEALQAYLAGPGGAAYRAAIGALPLPGLTPKDLPAAWQAYVDSAATAQPLPLAQDWEAFQAKVMAVVQRVTLGLMKPADAAEVLRQAVNGN